MGHAVMVRIKTLSDDYMQGMQAESEHLIRSHFLAK